MDINKYKVGDKASITKKITTEMVIQFSEISEDKNPLHLDEEFAKTTRFKGRISHGMLVGSLISAVIANILPGIGSIYLSQSLRFVKPVRHNDVIKAEVTVDEIMYEKSRLKLKTICTNQHDEQVIVGEAIVMI
ncbi:MaoC family dehydratase [Clostridium algoriphilum]|uniref:MaoC family dehydratase n=1 Tax=Clostridium algoriphilum TaxID=198347 RepID=UPI001CF2051F|nr:MaoC family dehydratase [Clostridium algoriphilum]MCB2293976.1 MaoC family dehydratase [Clostridium algoriphilum]